MCILFNMHGILNRHDNYANMDLLEYIITQESDIMFITI